MMIFTFLFLYNVNVVCSLWKYVMLLFLKHMAVNSKTRETDHFALYNAEGNAVAWKSRVKRDTFKVDITSQSQELWWDLKKVVPEKESSKY